MKYVTRINLKTDCADRGQLIDFCLLNDKQYLAIGWSYISVALKAGASYEEYYYAVKEDMKFRHRRMNRALNVFWNSKTNDLFWTRDLDGCYWLCRVLGKAEVYWDELMDIGAVIPIEAYKVGLEVPGQIKASFNRPLGGITEYIYDVPIVEYSKYMFNTLSNSSSYDYSISEGDFINNLPAFELEELVISYLQVKGDYYLLSNSIAKKSTTIKIECELMSRNISNPRKAVVQVKAGNAGINAADYKYYFDNGYVVYFYAAYIENKDKYNCVEITREELTNFFNEYEVILPESITQWRSLFP